MAPKEHVRPTTSNKKNRSKDASKDTTSSSQNVVEEPQGEEVVAEEVEEDSEIDEASLKGPFPGGPVNNELLVDYRHHVAYHIWNGKERSVLRCRQPVTQLDSWSLDDEAIIFVNRVRESGLLPLVQWSFKTINCSLISAMVERWHPETNTFHLPVGEMGITLDDVHQITGIPVMGQAVSKPQIENFDAAVELVRDTLHIDPSNIVSELATSNGRSVRLSWLKEHLATKSRMMPQHTIECAVRGYLLYLLGCTIFSDKTGTHVSVEYLQYLLDLKKVKDHAWGAATLAHLYRQLGIASRAKCKQISGYLTLLQAWVYEYIPLLRPVQDDRVTQGFPRAALWKNSRNFPGLQKNNVIVIRELLDSLTREQVDYEPYSNIRDSFPLQEYAFFNGCLVANRVYEPYMPERMLRQLGHLQTIPKGPTRPDGKTRRPRVASSYRVTYGGSVTYMEQWEDHLLGPRSRGPRTRSSWDIVPEYITWLDRVSHRFVQNPENRRFGLTTSSSHMDRSSDDDWRVMIAEYLQPLVQGRYTSDVLQRYMQNVINYCQDSTPLPTLTPPSTSIKERHNKRGIGRPSQH
ncbi:hypothetical protein QJS10_CPB11g00705 [Acorus calamus]|uniref:Aminotransferase-like plant mobile domain-containing protein n=1 Tax=Acorus calamus TaxID=4465 RepID=A0AAV9DUC7_ACOCL|nr:hypothetical protein QJS10_CPB11g00705 [Acorus calamus]